MKLVFAEALVFCIFLENAKIYQIFFNNAPNGAKLKKRDQNRKNKIHFWIVNVIIEFVRLTNCPAILSKRIFSYFL